MKESLFLYAQSSCPAYSNAFVQSLFAGPQNIVGEGGPVPVGYGRLVVGSQVISASYVIRDFNTENTSEYLRDDYGNLTPLLK